MLLMEKEDIKNLKKRYLLWLYKTTKEAVEKIERKFTQLEIDKFIIKEIKRHGKDKGLEKLIREYSEYIENKEKEGINLKFERGALRPDYKFLVLKLKAIEKAIVRESGNTGLRKIKDNYNQEMLRRILEERAIKT